MQATLASITVGMGLVTSLMTGAGEADPLFLADMVADLGRQAAELAENADQLAQDLAIMESELRAKDV